MASSIEEEDDDEDDDDDDDVWTGSWVGCLCSEVQ